MTGIPSLLSTAQLAEYLRVPEQTLVQWRKDGHGPPYSKLVRAIRYREDLVLAWLDWSYHVQPAEAAAQADLDTPDHTPVELPELLSEQALAEMLRVSIRVVRNMRKAQTGPPSIAVGRTHLYRADLIAQWTEPTAASSLVSAQS